jgi:hypothetical protein
MRGDDRQPDLQAPVIFSDCSAENHAELVLRVLQDVHPCLPSPASRLNPPTGGLGVPRSAPVATEPSSTPCSSVPV